MTGRTRNSNKRACRWTDRCNAVGNRQGARQLALPRPGQDQVATDRVELLKAEAAASHAKAEKRIEQLNSAIERERAERAVPAEGALEATRGLRPAATRDRGRAFATAAQRPRGGFRRRQGERGPTVKERQWRRPQCCQRRAAGSAATKRRGLIFRAIWRLISWASRCRLVQINFNPFRLACRSLPTMMWSCTAMPSGAPPR